MVTLPQGLLVKRRANWGTGCSLRAASL